MPRFYKKLGTRTYKNYSQETLLNALEDIKINNISLRTASEKYGIHHATLSRKIRGLFPLQPGRQTALSDDEELSLIQNIVVAGEWGFPMTNYDIRIIVKQYLDRKGCKEPRFKNNLPGPDWCHSFLRRHSAKLTTRLCENVKRARTQVTEGTVTEYFKELEQSVADVPPQNIMNYDETNFCDNPGRQKVIVKRGTKHPERCMDSSKTSTSVMIAGTASGELLPPYVVYKSTHLYDAWTSNGPKGARYNRTKSGWFDTTVFEDWFVTVALPYFKTLDGPKIMIGDNLSSHLTNHVINECQANSIRFVLLPPNSTHMCQPLDVAFFRPLKMAWREVLVSWKAKHRGTITKDKFPCLLKQTLDKVKCENLIAGFAACGIAPFNPDKILKKLPSWTKNSRSTDPQLWSDSFTALLEKTRYPDENQQTTRKKKVDVVPGRSIIDVNNKTENNKENKTELVEKNTTVTSENKSAEIVKKSMPGPKTKKRKVVVEYSGDSDTSDTNISVHDSSSNWNEEFSNVSSVGNEEDENANQRIYAVGDFLLVEFSSQGKKQANKAFVGEVIEVLPSDNNCQYYCKFMRKVHGLKIPQNTFNFPAVDDCSIIDICQVKLVLPKPKQLLRGMYTFDANIEV